MKLYNLTFPISFLTAIFLFSINSKTTQKIDFQIQNNTTDTVFIYQKTCNPDEVGMETFETNDTTFHIVTGLSSPISNEGLIAYYPMDEALHSPYQTPDYSGFGNHGTYKGSIFTNETFNKDGVYRKAYKFSGKGDSVLVSPNEYFKSDSYSISFWFSVSTDKVEPLNRDHIIFFGNGPGHRTFSMEIKRTGSNPAPPWSLQLNNSNSDNQDPDLRTDTIINPYQWYHAVALINSVNDTLFRSIYINGQFQVKDTLLGKIFYDDSHLLKIGTSSTNHNNEDFIGKLDEVRVFKRALSESEIEVLWESQSCFCPTVYEYLTTCDPENVGLDTIVSNNTSFITVTGLDSPISNDGLIAYYPLDKDLEENGFARDMSGYGNNGQIFGTKPVHNKDGLANKAYYFGGEEDSIVVSHTPVYENQDFTVSFWFKKNVDTLQKYNLDMMLFKGKHPTERTFSFALKWAEAPYILAMNSSNNEKVDSEIKTDTIINTHKWHHVVGTIHTIDDTLIERKFFLNGELIGEDSLIGYDNGTLYIEDYDMTMASWPANYPNNEGKRDFIGEMDEVRIYNRILSNDEIMTLFNSPNCPCAPVYEYLTTCNLEKVGIDTTIIDDTTYIRVTGLEGPISNEGLIGYYPFDIKYDESDIAKDMSGYGNDVDGSQLSATHNKDLLYGKAYHFDGIKRPLVAPPTDKYLSLNYTVSLWIRPTSDTIQNPRIQALVYMGRTAAFVRTFWLEIKDDNHPAVPPWDIQLLNSGTGSSGIISDEFLRVNNIIYPYQWHHLVGTIQTINDTLIRKQLFLNGEKIGSNDFFDELYLYDTQLSTFEDSLVIGGTNNYDPPDTRDFIGDMDEVRIYNRILSDDEIKTLFESSVCQCAPEYEFLTTCNPEDVGMQKDTIDGREHIEVTALNSLISTDSLIAYFPMGAEFGVDDYSGFVNHGTTAGVQVTGDRKDNPLGGYYFGGDLDSIHIKTNEIYNSRNLSVSFWFRNLSNNIDSIGRDKLVQKGGAHSRPFSFEIKHEGQDPPWALQMNTTSKYNNTSIDDENLRIDGLIQNDSAWHHVTGTIHQFHFDSIERKLYYDGILQKTDTVLGQLALNTSPILLGGEIHWQTSDGDLIGELDDFRLYSRILSKTEIETLCDLTNPDCHVIYQFETICDKDEVGSLIVSSNDTLYKTYFAQVSPVSNQDMIGYYPIIEGDGPGVQDCSGFDNDGVPFGEKEITEDKCGRPNQVFNMIDESGRIRIDRKLYYETNRFTFSLWFNKTNNTLVNDEISGIDDIDGVITKGYSDVKGSSFYLLLKDQPQYIGVLESEPPFALALLVSNGLEFTTIETTPLVTPNTYYHFAGVIKEDKIKLFIDGVQYEEKPFNGPVNSLYNTGAMKLGNYTSNLEGYAKGKLDEVRFYRRALSDLEIQKLYENHCAPPQIDTSICNGEIYSINNEDYTQTGLYELNLPNFFGCDSLVNLNLTVYEIPIFQFDTTICANDSISVCDTIFAVPYSNEVVMQTIICKDAAQTECDSIVEIAITTLPIADSFTDTLVCFTESVEICNETISVHTGLNEIIQICPEAGWNGCDSIVEMMLEVQTSRDTMINSTLCPGDLLEVCDTVFALGIGIHQFEYLCTSLIEPYCDSLIEINAEVLPFFDDTSTISLCIPTNDSVQISDTVYTCIGFPFGSYTDSLIRCDTVHITTIHCNFCGLDIPSAFSPNGDGINDTFVIPDLNDNPSEFGNNELWILNRREEVVYRSVDYKNDWEGLDLQGNPLPVGTYLFRFKHENSKGEESVISDMVTIIR